jgi:restriction system protein
MLVALIVGSAQAKAIGPSFDCSKAATTEQHIICADPDLSRSEMEFIQAYYALRQEVGPTGWETLKSEDLTFLAHASEVCAIPTSAPQPASVPTLASCLSQAFEGQRNIWLSRLSGPASEEARRPIEQHVALQRVLQQDGYLPATEIVDGVYGAATRAAVSSWQRSHGRQETGFIGDSDAYALLNTNPAQSPLTIGKSYRIQHDTIGCRDPQIVRKFTSSAPTPPIDESWLAQLPSGYCARIDTTVAWTLVALQADLAVVMSRADSGPSASFYVPVSALYESGDYQPRDISQVTVPPPVTASQSDTNSTLNSGQPTPSEQGITPPTLSTIVVPPIGQKPRGEASGGQSPLAQMRTASPSTSTSVVGNAAASDEGTGWLVGLMTVALAILAIVVARYYLAHQRQVRALAIARKEIDQQASRLRIRRMQTVQQDPYGTVLEKRWEEEKEYFVRTRLLPLFASAGVQACYPGTVALQIQVMIDKASLRGAGPMDEGRLLSYMSDPEIFDLRMDPIDYERYCAIQLQAAGWTTRPTPATGDQGADIIAERLNVVLVAQCKLYSNPIGNKAVQEVIAARTFYSANLAIVISNAPYTLAARQLALASSVQLLHHEELTTFVPTAPELVWKKA